MALLVFSRGDLGKHIIDRTTPLSNIRGVPLVSVFFSVGVVLKVWLEKCVMWAPRSGFMFRGGVDGREGGGRTARAHYSVTFFLFL